MTHRDGDTRLFLDGSLQFSTVDEYRYHEALVHPAMGAARERRRVLVLGGGDGLAAREALRWPEVEELVLVDLDPLVTRLFTEREELAALNGGALRDPRVRVENADAFQWLREGGAGAFGGVIIDFPDPNHYALGKLYTTAFFRLLRPALSEVREARGDLPGALDAWRKVRAFHHVFPQVFVPDPSWVLETNGHIERLRRAIAGA